MRTFLKSLVRGDLSYVAQTLTSRLYGVADPDRFLRKVSGVIHVGANMGQERETYAKYGQRVLWIEPVPNIFNILSENIKLFPQQQAVNRLITDKDAGEYVFHIASNEGMSSSILPLNRHREIWPEVHFDSSILLRSSTLDTLLHEISAGKDDYDALVIDVQGAELLVLRGAQDLLSRVKYVKTEAADFESYSGCAKVSDLKAFLLDAGFRLLRSQKFAEKAGVGSYYELLFEALSLVGRSTAP